MKLLRKKNNHLFLWILFAIAMVLPFAFSGSPFLLLVFCFIEIYTLRSQGWISCLDIAGRFRWGMPLFMRRELMVLCSCTNLPDGRS